MGTFEFLVCLLLVSVSAFLSSSEVALFSLSRFQLRHLRDRFFPSYSRLRKLLGDPSGLLITVLVGNEVLNIALSTVISNAISRGWGTDGPALLQALPAPLITTLPVWAQQTFLGVLIATPLVLIFCESTPKVTGARLNQLIAPLSSRPLLFIYHLFWPIRLFVKAFIAGLARNKGNTPEEEKAGEPRLKEEEFLLMVEEGHREGTVHENELELIRNVFEMDDRTAAEALTPIQQVAVLPAAASIKEAFAFIRKVNYYRIPVYGKNKRDVIGILYAKDLLRAKIDPQLESQSMETLMRKPFIVSASTRLNRLFRLLKQNKVHLAVVQNKQNEALGIITMNDILEQLFGDFFPESSERSAPRQVRGRSG